jgi:hypothetical protein
MFTYIRLTYSIIRDSLRYGYFLFDQPTTCPICGARSEIVGDFYHTRLLLCVNECLNINCKRVFLEVE